MKYWQNHPENCPQRSLQQDGYNGKDIQKWEFIKLRRFCTVKSKLRIYEKYNLINEKAICT